MLSISARGKSKPAPKLAPLTYARHDGLVNILTGLGDSETDTRSSTYRSTEMYQRSVLELESEWGSSWMAAREVNQPAQDMYREGFDLVNVEPPDLDLGRIKSDIEGAQQISANGAIDRQKGLLYYAKHWQVVGDKLGGSALMPIIDDGLDPIEPLDVRRIQRVVGWEVFDRSEITPYWNGAGDEPEYWILADVMKSSTGLRAGDVIHKSRLYRNVGVLLSNREMRYRQWWGGSVLELCWQQRRDAEEATAYANTYMDRASWLHYQMADLDGVLSAKDAAGNEIGATVLTERMRAFRRCTRTNGVAVTDGGKPQLVDETGRVIEAGRNADKLESVSENATQLPELVQLNLDQWQYGISMPVSIAFGKNQGWNSGENAGDWQSWGGQISARQSDQGTPLLNWMLTITFAARLGPTGGVIPTAYEIKWRPLTIATPLEEAQIDKARAEADEVRIRSKVANVGETREQRMVNGDFGPLRAGSPESRLRIPCDSGIALAAFDAGKSVLAGEVRPEFYAVWLNTIDPETFDSHLAASLAAAVSPVPAEVVELAAEAGAVVSGEVADEELEDEPDAVALAFSNDPLPSDLMKPRDIAAKLSTPEFKVPTLAITRRARAGLIRTWSILGRPGHSFGEVQAIIAGENGMIEPEEVAEPEPNQSVV
jgi:hypothetical protein